MPTTFVSYRREDAPDSAHRLVQSLSRRLGQENVFFDVESLRAGQNWTSELVRIGQLCDFLVAVIGPRWMEPGESGRPRISEKSDIVRLEIESVHYSGSKLIPVLVDGATMPAAADLPANLQIVPLSQAVTVNESTFEGDVSRLFTQFDDYERTAPPPDFSGRWGDMRMSGDELHIAQTGAQVMVTYIHGKQMVGQGIGQISGRTTVVHFGDQFSGGVLRLTLSLNGMRASGQVTSAGQSQEISLFRSDRRTRAVTPEMAQMADKAIGAAAGAVLLGGVAYGAKKLGRRIQQRREQKRAEQASHEAATAADPIEQLERLAELHAAGQLSDEEFAQAKSSLLERGSD